MRAAGRRARAPQPGRPAARRADGPTLTYLGHVDTVRADPDEWSRDPWCGDLEDGWVWGRGALDMKGQVASELAACLDAWPLRLAPARRAAAGDHRRRGGRRRARRALALREPRRQGALRLRRQRGRRRRRSRWSGRRLYTLSVGEKGVFRIQLRVAGTAGHASLPKVGDNALLKLAPLIAKLADQPPPEPTEVGLQFLSVVTGEELEGDDGLRAGLDAMRAMGAETAAAGRPAGRADDGDHDDADQGPRRREGERDPVLGRGPDRHAGPARASARRRRWLRWPADGRGTRRGRLRDRVQRGGRRQPVRVRARRCRDAIGEWVAEADPDGELAPIVMPGFSDSHWFRKAFPDASSTASARTARSSCSSRRPLIHGADERVPASDIGLAARLLPRARP